MPERAVISNTSPLLYLHQIRQLPLLAKLYQRILVPEAVVRELAAGAKQGVDTPDLTKVPWIEIRSVADPRLIPAMVDLGAGEAEVIALGVALRPSLLILDDQLGRRIADLLALTFTGTLGVLIKAKQAGHIEAVSPVLEALTKTTMRLHPDLIERALAEAGEL
jgi:predicted nucleic acid-binding protein